MSETKRYVLSIDCALAGCGCAVFDPDTGKSRHRTFLTGREQAAMLVPLVQETIHDAGVSFADVGLIVTTVGPGSFTGLRIGLSAAKSFALALNVPLQGVTTFDAILASCTPEDETGNFLVALETKRSDIYVQFYANGSAVDEPACLQSVDILLLAEKKAMTVCGDVKDRLVKEQPAIANIATWQDVVVPDPAVLAKLGHERFRQGILRNADPLYMRGADVSISKKILRTISTGSSL